MTKNTTPIRGFFFDIGGVLVRVDASESIRKIAEVLDVTPMQVRQAMSPQLLADYETGKLSGNEFYQNMLNNCDSARKIDFEFFKYLWQDVLFPKEAEIDFLKTLLKAYPVWLLSNTNDFHYDLMQHRFDILDLVNGGTYSFIEGYMKPSPEIYRAALAKTPFKPDEIVFIDDLEVNVRAARDLGIRAIQYFDYDQMLGELHDVIPEFIESL
ncbi:MAG: HAD family phosphatase [Lentisphaeria bacterium]|nr:HAD family phosphatase [Candidatus Neomarinimicrobiota bacterium]MCF7842416.1 HAD family phosphatase [Lentisphaeria bacterium]